MELTHLVDVLSRTYALSSEVVESRVGRETVFLHLESGRYLGLDAVATQIWELLREGMKPAEICVAVSDRFGVPLEIVVSDAKAFFESLLEQSLILEV